MASREIGDCHEVLQKAWGYIQGAFRESFPGWDIILVCTFRPVEEQFDLFKKGRRETPEGWIVDDSKSVVTQVDGRARLSNHNYHPARAFDVALKKPDGSITYDVSEPAWQALPGIATMAGVVNGGSWKSFKDFPHFELPKEESV